VNTPGSKVQVPEKSQAPSFNDQSFSGRIREWSADALVRMFRLETENLADEGVRAPFPWHSRIRPGSFCTARAFGILSLNLFWCLVLGIWSFVGGIAQAETAYLTPSADTTLLESFPANNFGANEYFNCGTTQNYTTNRALLKFDVAGAIPPGAQIRAVFLTVQVVGTPVDGDEPSNFALHRLLRDWGEGNKSGHPPQQSQLGQPATTNEATWTHRFAFTTNTWAAAGGVGGMDFATNASSETFVYGLNFSPYTFDSTPDLVADAQAWLDHTESNFGWLLLSQSEDFDFTARRFASREDPFRAPVLAVEYSIPRLEQITVTSNTVHLHFTAEAGQAYAVEHCDALAGGSWFILTNIPPSAAATSVLVLDSPVHPERYYRLVLP